MGFAWFHLAFHTNPVFLMDHRLTTTLLHRLVWHGVLNLLGLQLINSGDIKDIVADVMIYNAATSLEL